MILIENLTKKFADRFILDRVHYHFPQGENIALVGLNGMGKTTLLNILCNLEEYDSGKITQPKEMTLSYLPQEPNQNPLPTILEECLSGSKKLYKMKQELDHALKEMEINYSDDVYAKYEAVETRFSNMNGYQLEADAKGILAGLGFKIELFEESPTILSGGWRMRLELAKILLNKPDFLILDEPTNHLDLPSLAFLEKFLSEFTGTLLIVSHDRELLNRLSTKTLYLKNGKLKEYGGNFDFFLEQYELEQTQVKAQADALNKKMAQVQRFVDRFGAKASKAAQAESRKKMLARMEKLQEGLAVDQEGKKITIKIKESHPSGKVVLNAKNLTIGYPDKTLLKNKSFQILKEQKIAIIGANGLGKSTLLKTLMDMIPKIDGEFNWGHNVKTAFFAQEQLDFLVDKLNVLENVQQQNPALTEQEIRSLLGGFLISGQDILKPLKVLSGGEKSRVGLCCMISQRPNVLLLDEPTNHLDMISVEILASGLAEYKGTVMFVSHNRSFIDAVATHLMIITPSGKLDIREGNFSDHEEFLAKELV